MYQDDILTVNFNEMIQLLAKRKKAGKKLPTCGGKSAPAPSTQNSAAFQHQWLMVQRQRQRDGLLTREQTLALTDLGVHFSCGQSADDEGWFEKHEQLVQFYQTNGRWPKGRVKTSPESKLSLFRKSLYHRVHSKGNRLRVTIAEGTLMPRHIEKLRDDGFLFGAIELYGEIEKISEEVGDEQSAPSDRNLLEDNWTPNINTNGDRFGRGVLGCACGQRHELAEYSQSFPMLCVSCEKWCNVVAGCAGFDQMAAKSRVIEVGGESYSTWQCSDCYGLSDVTKAGEEEQSFEEAGGCVCGKNFSHGDIDHWLECEECGWLHVSGNCVNFDEAKSEDNWVCGFCGET